MEIAAFYENIRTGAEHDGIPMTEAVASLRGAGLQGLYVSCESTELYADELAETVRETGVGIVGLHAWVHFDRDAEEARRAVDRAAELGTDHLLIVPVRADHDFEKLIAGVKEAAAYGKSRGVQVCMEDLDQADSPYNSLAGMRTFLDRIPDLGCCFDTGNWIMHQEDETEAFRELRSRICAMHLKDRAMTPIHADDAGTEILDGSFRYPVPVGKGILRVGEILSGAGDVPVIVELYGYSPAHMLEGIRESVAWVRNRIP